MFENFSQEERRMYLKFVWGRAKLPVDTSTLEYKHQVMLYEHKEPDSFPEAHTCFFQCDISAYKDLETMTARFKTAISLCGEIDGDYSAEDIADEDGNRND
jgi:E3 ubiquitin-protein ligase HERC1